MRFDTLIKKKLSLKLHKLKRKKLSIVPFNGSTQFDFIIRDMRDPRNDDSFFYPIGPYWKEDNSFMYFKYHIEIENKKLKGEIELSDLHKDLLKIRKRSS